MTRKQRLLNIMIQESNDVTVEMIREGFNGFTTAYVSSLSGVDRSNTSRELNELFDSGVLTKIKGKPVKFFSVSVLETLLGTTLEDLEVNGLKDYIVKSKEIVSTFDNVIGSTGSLKNAISKSKAAMIYPPFGLHCLLVGPTGVGKTMFADYMYEFAKSSGVLSENAKLVVFNCAEYSENPQLILSQLFGHKKGSFTGAVSDKDGLVHQAKDGILFLDEIHRLPAEGQEMLFMLMDKHQYRKLGESDTVQEANVLIIAATTENIQSSLLQTFIRRIPMLIDLPSISERPISERYNLLKKFFSEESLRTNMDIVVDENALKSFLGYNCLGNVGQLSSDIKLVCARAYLNAIMDNNNVLKIDRTILPDHIMKGIIDASANKEIASICDTVGPLGLKFQHDNSVQIFSEIDFKEDVYAKIHKQYEKYNFNAAINNIDEEQFMVKRNLSNYVESLFQTALGVGNYNEELYKIVSPRVYEVVELSLKIAEKKLKRNFSKKTLISFAIHVNALIESGTPRVNYNEDNESVKTTYPEEFHTAKIIKHFLSEELNFVFPDNELIFFTLFLNMDEINTTTNHVAILVLAHGNGVAVNMAVVANTLLDTNHAHGMDMGLDEDVHSFFEKVENKVKTIDEGEGVLLLVDMGSLKSFGDILSSRHSIKVKTIDMVSTLTVIESTRKALLGEYSIEQLEKDIMESIRAHQTVNMIDIKDDVNEKDYVIVSTCMTGKGAAIAISNYVTKALPLIRKHNIKFINTNRRDFKLTMTENLTVIAVIGVEPITELNVPYIGSDELLIGNGLKDLSFNIQSIFGSSVDQPLKIKQPGLVKIMKESLNIIDIDRLLPLLETSFNNLNERIQFKEYNQMLVSYFMHVGVMIERILSGFPHHYHDAEQRMFLSPELSSIIKEEMIIFEKEFSIIIPDTEHAYILDTFDTD